MVGNLRQFLPGSAGLPEEETGGMVGDGAAVQSRWGRRQQGFSHWGTAALATLGFLAAPRLPLQQRHGLVAAAGCAATECELPVSEFLCCSCPQD